MARAGREARRVVPAHPAAGGAARRHVSADERGPRAHAAARGRRGAGDALFHQQPRGCGRRAGERLPADRRARAAWNAARCGRHEPRHRGGGRAARPPGALSASRTGVPGGRWRASAARGGVLHRARLLHLRDQLDPDALARARRVDAFVRADARRLHLRPGARRPRGAPAHRYAGGADAASRWRPDRDGARGARHAAGVRRQLLVDGSADAGPGAERRRLSPVQRGGRAHRRACHAAGDLLRRHDAAAPHRGAAAARPRRGSDRADLCGEHARRHRRRSARRAPRAAGARAQGGAHRRRANRRRAGSSSAALPRRKLRLRGRRLRGAVRGGGARRRARCQQDDRRGVSPRRPRLVARRHGALHEGWQDRHRPPGEVSRGYQPAHQRQVGRLDQHGPRRRARLRRDHHGAHRGAAPRPQARGEIGGGDRHRHRAHHAHAAAEPRHRASRDDRDRARDGPGGARLRAAQQRRVCRSARHDRDRRRERLLLDACAAL